ncbi:Permease [Paenibacillus terrae HPL-003]|uniref:Permease n=1 Tax=Paenibacillus terrae (strain HPL-003) TaxID=985665 RepID=G7W354_PAETH|nr:MFS transporter [Paenibacillus terrae]AET60710.1 Permease [Paenibacillus terrae HPL-003]
MTPLFKNSRFVRFFASRTSANIADSIYSIVLLYFVQQSTQSVAMTSFTYTAVSAASIFSFLVGPLVDRYSPALLASIALFTQAVLILAVPFLIQDGMVHLVTILVIVFIASCFSTLFYPANSKMLPQLVRSPDLIVQANSMISSTDQVINIAGYLAGASLIIAMGMKNTFFLASAMLFLAGFVYVRLNKQIDAPAVEDTNGRGSLKLGYYLKELKEGYLFVKRHAFLRLMLPFFALTNFSMAILIITMPSIAVSYGSPIYYSLLYVAYFIGIFIGSLLVSVLKKNGITIAVSWVAMGLAIYVFSIVPEMWMKLLAALLLGIFTGIINVLQTSLIQIITPLPLLGRVASFLNTLSSAALPLGALIGGALALRFALSEVLFFSGLITALCGLIMFLVKDIRQFEIPSGEIGRVTSTPVTEDIG